MPDWKWLAGQARPLKWPLLLAVLLCVLDMLSLLGITAVQKWIIDDIFVAGEYGLLTRYLLLFAALIVGYNAVHLLSYMLNRRNEYALLRRLSVQLMHVMYRMPVSRYHSERIGALAQRFHQEVRDTSHFVAHLLPGSLTGVLRVAVLAGFIGWAEPLMLALIVVLGLVYTVIGRKLGPDQKAAGKAVQAARSDVAVQLEEGIASTREVIAFHRHAWELERYAHRFRHFFGKVMAEGKLANRQLAWSEPLRWGMNLAVLGYGAYLTITGSLSIGSYIVVYQFASQLLDGMQQLLGYGLQFSARMGTVERLRSFMTDSEPEDGRLLEGPIRSLTFHEVGFAYPGQRERVLDGLTVELPIGGKTAFVGASGGGKSTVAQLLERFYDPQEGEIRVSGEPLRELALDSWRSRIVLVPQDPYLFPDTIRHNLALGREGVTEQACEAACRAAEIHADIAALPSGYDTVLGERGITLSGGQRQRLAIARALLADAEVLVLDEATSALDLETERRVQRNLDRLREGKTTIVIAHRLSTVENADCIYVMSRGRIVESGTHEELLRSASLYKELVYARLAN
ncbi:ABC transporter ATP-binding protein [Paenibacillus sp. IB182496]|uniref:ABC transporter ATP-binding protein n=1 Tax=Paenibacillus sabuli TaxID=2772509 RepID=A0A927BWB2_9BACL|nr:ABC transporter ATP-binding protein [Paenibacillus sabuli]MBD2848037.1 ABC transporter ATP-binding protein [Paenibacillus sabuli]